MKVTNRSDNSLTILETYAKKGGYYFNYSDYEGKIGKIRGKVWYNTPTGIYCYPLTHEFIRDIVSRGIPFAKERKVINIFKPLQGIRWLDLDNYSETDLKRDLSKLRKLRASFQVKVDTELVDRVLTRFNNLLREYYVLRDLEIKLSQDASAGETVIGWGSITLRESLHSRILGWLEDTAYAARRFTQQMASLPISDLLKDILSLAEQLQRRIVGVSDFSKLKKLADLLREFPQKMNAAIETTPSHKLFDQQLTTALETAKSVSNQTASKIWNASRVLSGSQTDGKGAGKWNTTLRYLGYDAAKDKGMGLIHPNEKAQAVFLRSDKVKLVATVNNPHRTIEKAISTMRQQRRGVSTDLIENQIIYIGARVTDLLGAVKAYREEQSLSLMPQSLHYEYIENVIQYLRQLVQSLLPKLAENLKIVTKRVADLVKRGRELQQFYNELDADSNTSVKESDLALVETFAQAVLQLCDHAKKKVIDWNRTQELQQKAFEVGIAKSKIAQRVQPYV